MLNHDGLELEAVRVLYCRMLCKRLKDVPNSECNFEQEYDQKSKLGWEPELRSHTIAGKHKIIRVVYHGLSIRHHLTSRSTSETTQVAKLWDDVRGISCQRSQLWGLWHTKAFARMYLSLTLSILFIRVTKYLLNFHWPGVADRPHLNLLMVLGTIILSVEGMLAWARSLTKFISTISQFSPKKCNNSFDN